MRLGIATVINAKNMLTSNSFNAQSTTRTKNRLILILGLQNHQVPL
jgi:hypothetical protein